MSARRMSAPYSDDPTDDGVLQALGYKPVLARRMSGFGNYAISFSVICPLAGCLTLFGFGLNTGGPAVMMWGWVIIGFLTLLVALSLAEVTSAYPTSGGLYYMAHQLGGPRWGWFTGWFNLLGLLGAIAGIDYGCALFVGAFANLQWGITPTPELTMWIFAGILLLHGTLNTAGVRLASILNSISVWWQVCGVALIIGALSLAPAEHQDVSFVFGQFENGTGFSSAVYVCMIGSLLAAYTFCGYDASSHLSEETKNAQIAAPRGMVRSVWTAWIVGFLLLAGLLFAIQDYAGTVATATGVPPAQIMLDVLGATTTKLLLLVVIVAQLFCGNAETAAASRMVYAFSRDGALPGSHLWRRVNRNSTPVAAVWASVGVALLIALPSLYSPTAYAAVTAINVIGITPAYIIPVYLRRRHSARFTPGPWTLGRWSGPIGWTAVAYVIVITIVFCLPQASPITVSSFNYAGVTALAMIILAAAMWKVRGKSQNYKVPTLGNIDEQTEFTRSVL
ncbi:amino acid permease [Streptomyces poonensis]|uniref:Amino acid permease n=2 Tax=Streptomyces poonensis TaxID=68255 RepID=A0A918UGS9_9ACTN|nr:amino acid permease [Streptomyces poonensis]GLJ92604.1 amino acid permease [Streptomyces poonensis]